MGDNLGQTSSLIERMMDRLGVSSVFGEPIKEGETTIVPLATVVYGFGLGSGSGPAQAKPGDEPPSTGAMAGGEGGGAGGQAKPAGYIRLGGDEPQFVSTSDPNKVALAGIMLSAWSVFWITKTVRAFVKR